LEEELQDWYFNRPISDELTKSLGIKSEYIPRAVVQLVNVFFYCVVYDWTVKDEQRLYDMTPNGILLDDSLLPKLENIYKEVA
jgi:hypothetical protein